MRYLLIPLLLTSLISCQKDTPNPSSEIQKEGSRIHKINIERETNSGFTSYVFEYTNGHLASVKTLDSLGNETDDLFISAETNETGQITALNITEKKAGWDSQVIEKYTYQYLYENNTLAYSIWLDGGEFDSNGNQTKNADTSHYDSTFYDSQNRIYLHKEKEDFRELYYDFQGDAVYRTLYRDGVLSFSQKCFSEKLHSSAKNPLTFNGVRIPYIGSELLFQHPDVNGVIVEEGFDCSGVEESNRVWLIDLNQSNYPTKLYRYLDDGQEFVWLTFEYE